MIEPKADAALAELPGYLLRRAASVMMAEFANRLAPLDLKISELTVLFIAGSGDHLTSSEIGQIADIKRANMPKLLDPLEQQGLIRREPLDGRRSAIVVTEVGETRLTEARKIIASFEADLLETVPAKHRGHLVPALDALRNYRSG
ncbi:MarR family winged helix-turn-helix transcriptional regulator [Aurantiacibacter suaedae]|uniref:MarR family winged helix-turn-helix transcriptional regulator n=1 Tax=Aurantiacibacter suaedae TaxID=2545755 RepID=UPI0010F8F9B6|nr:MarR family transcriptional regulator [Aurantiacibacter suaedae]